MKRLTALFAITPGLAMAHGAHAPVPPAAHDTIHIAPWAAAMLVALAILALWWQERRS